MERDRTGGSRWRVRQEDETLGAEGLEDVVEGILDGGLVGQLGWAVDRSFGHA